MPLSLAQVNDRLRQLTYRPGWLLTAYQGAHEGPRLQISALVENSYRPGEMTRLDIRCPLPAQCWDTTGELDRWLLWRLQQVEVHEAMEWLHGPDGRPVFDPHRPNADRDEPPEGAPCRPGRVTCPSAARPARTITRSA